MSAVASSRTSAVVSATYVVKHSRIARAVATEVNHVQLAPHLGGRSKMPAATCQSPGGTTASAAGCAKCLLKATIGSARLPQERSAYARRNPASMSKPRCSQPADRSRTPQLQSRRWCEGTGGILSAGLPRAPVASFARGLCTLALVVSRGIEGTWLYSFLQVMLHTVLYRCGKHCSNISMVPDE